MIEEASSVDKCTLPREEVRPSDPAAPRPLGFKRFCRSAVLPVVRRTLPLEFRKLLAKWVGRSRFGSLAIHLLENPAHGLSADLHRYLWGHHLAYAEGYDTLRFAADRLDPSRRALFRDIEDHLRGRGIAVEDVKSVFDAGCSLGYVLRYAETDVFRSASVLRGLDIDKYAIKSGTNYLRGAGSKIEIFANDIADLPEVMGQGRYDVVLCCGVLLYLDQAAAEEAVNVLLSHTGLVLGLLGLAHPSMENFRLSKSDIRISDGAYIHNLDALVRKAGGRVAQRRWRKKEGNEYSPPYCVLAEPAPE